MPPARRPGRRHPTLQAEGGQGVGEGSPAAEGVAVTEVRMYRRPVSTWWWLRKRSYFLFVMRELSSIFIAWLVVYLLLLVAAIGRGAAAYSDFLKFAANPAVVVLNIIAFAFVVLHTITWFSLTPKAMDARRGGRPVPAAAVIAAQYVGLRGVSAFVIWRVSR